MAKKKKNNGNDTKKLEDYINAQHEIGLVLGSDDIVLDDDEKRVLEQRRRNLRSQITRLLPGTEKAKDFLPNYKGSLATSVDEIDVDKYSDYFGPAKGVMCTAITIYTSMSSAEGKDADTKDDGGFDEIFSNVNVPGTQPGTPVPGAGQDDDDGTNDDVSSASDSGTGVVASADDSIVDSDPASDQDADDDPVAGNDTSKNCWTTEELLELMSSQGYVTEDTLEGKQYLTDKQISDLIRGVVKTKLNDRQVRDVIDEHLVDAGTQKDLRDIVLGTGWKGWLRRNWPAAVVGLGLLGVYATSGTNEADVKRIVESKGYATQKYVTEQVSEFRSCSNDDKLDRLEGNLSEYRSANTRLNTSLGELNLRLADLEKELPEGTIADYQSKIEYIEKVIKTIHEEIRVPVAQYRVTLYGNDAGKGGIVQTLQGATEALERLDKNITALDQRLTTLQKQGYIPAGDNGSEKPTTNGSEEPTTNGSEEPTEVPETTTEKSGTGCGYKPQGRSPLK